MLLLPGNEGAAYSERMALETEIERYNELLPELLKVHGEGKFAVIHERELLGVFPSNREGYRAGLNAFGVVSFLLRPIRAVQVAPRIPALELGLLRGRL